MWRWWCGCKEFFKKFNKLSNWEFRRVILLIFFYYKQIRKQVCKDLVTVCKKVSTFVPKIADVFAQLMQTDDTMEQKGLESCLISLLHIDSQGLKRKLKQGIYFILFS